MIKQFITLFFLPLIWIKRLIPEKQKRILIVPHLRIGDFVVQSPIFREIKKNHKNSYVAVLLINKELLPLVECNPYIDRIIVWPPAGNVWAKVKTLFLLLFLNINHSFNLAYQSWATPICLAILSPRNISMAVPGFGKGYKLFYKLSATKVFYYPRGSYSTSVYLDLLKELNIPASDVSRENYLCPEDKISADKILAESGINLQKKIIGICPGCGNKIKLWPEKYFAELSTLLIEKYDSELIFLGDSSDSEKISRIMNNIKYTTRELSGRLNLGQTAAIAKKLDLFISVDTGLFYLAEAAGTNVINISGPVAIEEQFHESKKGRAIQLGLPCRPCSFVDPPAKDCHIGSRDCVLKTTPEIVMEKIDEAGFLK